VNTESTDIQRIAKLDKCLIRDLTNV